MKQDLYGVDISKKITPIMVRDAIVQCFIEAHSEILEDMKEFGEVDGKEDFENIKKMNVKMLVRKSFEDTGEDYDNPNKKALIKSVEYLSKFSLNFRKTDIIDKHAKQINSLIEKLD